MALQPGDFVMNAEEDAQHRRRGFQIGEDLSALSVAELDHRVTALQVEIDRLNKARAAKVAHLDAAAGIFGKLR
jgi:uncharacterized small protein (DUF1192 family)